MCEKCIAKIEAMSSQEILDELIKADQAKLLGETLLAAMSNIIAGEDGIESFNRLRSAMQMAMKSLGIDLNDKAAVEDYIARSFITAGKVVASIPPVAVITITELSSN